MRVRDARRRRAPHHEGLRPHPEERALACVSKDEATERAGYSIFTPDDFTTALQRASSLSRNAPNSFGPSARGSAPRVANFSTMSGDCVILLMAAPRRSTRTCGVAADTTMPSQAERLIP